MIAGVCAGFAQAYGWDVTIVRLVVVLAMLVGFGTVGFAYLVAWIVMPKAPFAVPAYVVPNGPAAPTTGAVA